MEEEKSVLRWGGMAGLLAGILIVGFFVVFQLVPLGTGDPEGLVEGFPDNRAAITTRSSLAIVAFLLSIALFLALYRALRGTGLGPALFGSVLGGMGLIMLVLAVTSVFVAYAPLSDLYHAPGATSDEQATALALAHATQGITNTFFFVGNLFVMVGLIALGVAMLGAPNFGKGFGGLSVVLGAAGAVGLYANLVVTGPMIVAVLATLVFLFLFGWKLYSLSKSTTGG